MPYVAPSTVTTLQTYTSAAHNVIVNDIIDINARAQHYIYTNEAARDAAITAPFEGMMCYLTAPTVPSSTVGEVTQIPSGIITVYNGSVWVCTTPIGAYTSTTGTTTSTSSTAILTSGGTNPVVYATTGTSALITVSVNSFNNGSAVNTITFNVNGGAANAFVGQGSVTSTAPMTTTFSFIVTGLSAGTNYFSPLYAVNGGTGSFRYRQIIVQGIA